MELMLNWLWQGIVVALAAEAVLALIPRACTQARYGFVGLALVLVLALPAASYIGTIASPVSALDDMSAALGPVVSMPATWWTSTPLAIVLWILWSVFSAGRLSAAVAALREAKRQCRECPRGVEARLHHWSRVKETGRRARLVLSVHVRSAAVLGCGSPTIALSPTLLERLADADLDRVVIHEWAHVQRRDDIAQFAQRLVRIVAGWHPAVWWLERRLELEREVACDEMSVALTGSRKGYATCLATLAAFQTTPVVSLPALAVSSSGLRRRVLRILGMHRSVSARSGGAIAVCAGIALATLALVVGNVQIAQSADAASSSVPIATTAAEDGVAAYSSTPLDRPAQPTRALSSMSRGRSRSSESAVRSSKRDDASPSGAEISTTLRVELPDTVATISRSIEPPTPPRAPLTSRVEAVWTTSIPGVSESTEVKPRSPWMAAADGGVAIGRHSQNAGVATAGFFTRFGKKIADSF